MFAETIMGGSLNGRFRLALQNANENYERMFRNLDEFRNALKRWMNTRMQPLKDKEALYNLTQHKPRGLESFLEQFQFIALELQPNSEEVLEQLGRGVHPDCAYNLVSKVADREIVTLDAAIDYLKRKNTRLLMEFRERFRALDCDQLDDGGQQENSDDPLTENELPNRDSTRDRREANGALTQSNGNKCYGCGESGHFARDCPDGQSSKTFKPNGGRMSLAALAADEADERMRKEMHSLAACIRGAQAKLRRLKAQSKWQRSESESESE